MREIAVPLIPSATGHRCEFHIECVQTNNKEEKPSPHALLGRLTPAHPSSPKILRAAAVLSTHRSPCDCQSN